MRRYISFVFVVGLLLVACSSRPTVVTPPEEKLLHIHGLGVNPTDGTLFVATHYGLYKMEPNGRPARVGESRRDLMGFAVVGPDHFVASGHPDVDEMRREGAPPLLGLIESRDGGKSWRTLSLKGEADFHALRVAGGKFFGYNSSTSQFMVSPNGTEWEARSSLVLFDFAVSEANPDLVVGSTGSGTVVSVDGGLGWASVTSPRIQTISFTEGAFWGVGPEGILYHSPDGVQWHETGKFEGQPTAFLATPRAFYLATMQQSIYISEDLGARWRQIYSEG